jgi:hypothetical protein
MGNWQIDFGGLKGHWYCVYWCLLCLYDGLPRILGSYHIITQNHHLELMKSVGNHGGLSLIFMMKVMVRCFVSDRS